MRIMANVFISYETVNCYLEALMREGLITYHPDTKIPIAPLSKEKESCVNQFGSAKTSMLKVRSKRS
jgi:predicted transcriptional regulator